FPAPRRPPAGPRGPRLRSMPPRSPLTIVVPCFEPPTGWAANVTGNLAQIERRLGFAPELVLVDDGSVGDETRRGIEEIRATLPRATILRDEVNMGKGHALRRGVSVAHTP